MGSNKGKTTGIFTFDGPLYKDINGIYCSMVVTNEMLSRFFSVVDELFVIIRVFCVDKTYPELNLCPLKPDKMTIIEVGNLLTPKGIIVERKAFEKSIQHVVEQADMIFARMPGVISNSVLKIAKNLKKPYLAEVGGCAWDSFWNHSLYGKIVAGYFFLEEKKYVSHAEFAVYVTKKFLQERYPNKGKTGSVSNVYLNDMSDDVLEKRLRKIENMDTKNIVIGQAVNSIDVRYKGEQYILRAMPKLKKKGINIIFQVAGAGDGAFLKKQAEKYGVADRFKLMGAMKKVELEEWYQSIDVYAQPSKQEGLPRAVIEAMGTGCPSIGSDLAGIPELLDRECLFRPGSIDEIVSVIEHLLNKDVLKKRAKTNFERAKEYNIEDLEKKRQKIFKEYGQFIWKDQ